MAITSTVTWDHRSVGLRAKLFSFALPCRMSRVRVVDVGRWLSGRMGLFAMDLLLQRDGHIIWLDVGAEVVSIDLREFRSQE